jgi:hypothetical protein
MCRQGNYPDPQFMAGVFTLVLWRMQLRVAGALAWVKAGSSSFLKKRTTKPLTV